MLASLSRMPDLTPPTSASLGITGVSHRAWPSFAMFPRLVSNFWAQMICPPWPPKMLGLTSVSHHQIINIPILCWEKKIYECQI